MPSGIRRRAGRRRPRSGKRGGVNNLRIYGYFTSPNQTEPEYDPGLEVDCPICHKQLSRPMVTPSLMLQNDQGQAGGRSYFYRVHKACYEALTPEQETALDSVIIDAIAASKNSN